MSSTELCEWCARIPFHDLSQEKDYDLGTGSWVKGSSCPLCQLVVQAHYQTHKRISDQEPVKLSWMEVFELGGAFFVPTAGVSISFGIPESSHDVVRDMRAEQPGRCLLQPTGPLIDTDKVLGWIRSCDQKHGDSCQLPREVPFAEAFRGLPFIRLIDVQAKCLVELQHLEKYMALSYVWGGVANLRLTKANRAILLTPGSLTKVSSRLPKTIYDAIDFTQHLGCRYLWVDALCLVQNDANDRDQGINTMDLIYERAWLTIVAACGHDANARLPGVQEGTRKPSTNTCLVKPGISMGVVSGLDDLVGCSIWDSRGWTYQERLLSRRAICFVDDKLFYRCRVAVRAEHTVDLHRSLLPRAVTTRQMLSQSIWMRSPLEDFREILHFYSMRFLTNQDDGARAMAGILQRFSAAMGCQFLEGLPTATFDFCVIFRCYGGVFRRRPAFPSYSWTGWSGTLLITWAVDPPFYLNERLRDATWIIWYKRSPSGVLTLVWDPSSEPSFPFDNMRYVGYRERRPFSHGRYTPAHLDTSRTTPSEAVSFSRDVPPYHILQFWTISVFYKISDIDVFDAIGDLVDCNGAKCGSVWLDGFEEATCFESQTCFEAILLSESDRDPNLRLDNYDVTAYPQVTEGLKWFTVLLLEWRGGLAERRGFGYIIQDAMVNSLAPGPVWKEILLA